MNLPEETKAFPGRHWFFLRKYQLMHLATWELPYPQGPLSAIPLESARCFLGPHQSVSTLPAYYDVPSSEDVRQATRDQQEHAAKQAGLEGVYPLSGLAGRGDQESVYEEVFRLWLLEQTVISRYGKSYGLTTKLINAFCLRHDFSPDRVRQIRKLYLPFLPCSSKRT